MCIARTHLSSTFQAEIPSEPTVRMCFWSQPLGHCVSRCVLFFPLFWGRKQQVKHILCCDKLFWRQEIFQGFKARILLKVLDKDEWLELLVLLHVVGDVYHGLDLSALISNCKKRSCHTVFMVFFLLFSIENSFCVNLVFSSGSGISLISTSWWVGFPPPQNSVIPTFIKKVEPQISLLTFGVYFCGNR